MIHVGGQGLAIIDQLPTVSVALERLQMLDMNKQKKNL